jgi:hypothetical protein
MRPWFPVRRLPPELEELSFNLCSTDEHVTASHLAQMEPWPSSLRKLHLGYVSVLASEQEGITALQHLHRVVASLRATPSSCSISMFLVNVWACPPYVLAAANVTSSCISSCQLVEALCGSAAAAGSSSHPLQGRFAELHVPFCGTLEAPIMQAISSCLEPGASLTLV